MNNTTEHTGGPKQPEQKLDDAITRYVATSPLGNHPSRSVQHAVMVQLEGLKSQPSTPLDWVTQHWWRAVMASALPLVLGFMVGFSAEYSNQQDATNVTGIVYYEQLEEANSDEF